MANRMIDLGGGSTIHVVDSQFPNAKSALLVRDHIGREVWFTPKGARALYAALCTFDSEGLLED